jgi:hypothetical protein
LLDGENLQRRRIPDVVVFDRLARSTIAGVDALLSSRPTPNPRRGILRAAVTVIVLTALLIVAILIVSSLSAPSAKAPTAPLTPGPITPIATAVKTTPHAVPSPTHKKKTLGSLLVDRRGVQEMEHSPGDSMLRRASALNAGDVAVRSHEHVAWFTPPGYGSPRAVLHVQSLPHGRQLNLGAADSIVKPVWSAGGRYLLYVRLFRPQPSTGPRWTLLQFDARTETSIRLVTVSGYAMTPLGWWHAHPLFLISNSSDTSLFVVKAGRAHYVTVLAPQIITSAALSPTAPLIAFAAPTNCYNCTLEMFDLRTADAWSGPSGIANESLMAWSDDGRYVFTVVNGKIVQMPSSIGGRSKVGGTARLSRIWRHTMRVSIVRTGVRITDQITGHSVIATFRKARS